MKAKTGRLWALSARNLAACASSIIVAWIAVAGSTLLAQAPASGQQQPAPARTAQPATTSPQAIRPPRRDPFRPLIVTNKQVDTIPARLPAGKAGLVIGQLTVQGIVRNLDGKWMAVVDNQTKRSYFIYERDELYNGVVTRITGESVTFEERSVDATGRTRTREVVKRIGGV